MSLFARSDVVSISIPEESGGCGQAHRRPVSEGAPSKLWELDCPQCSTALKGDPMWSGTSDSIPRTPDEQAKDEEEAKRGLISRKEDLVSGIAEGLSKGLSNLTTCQNCGKMSPSGMRFCGECGHKLGAKDEDPKEESKDSGQADLRERLEEDESGESSDPKQQDLSKLHIQTLRKMARDEGLDDSGTKDDIISRIHGN